MIYFSIIALSLFTSISLKAQELTQSFSAATITVKFYHEGDFKGATINDVIGKQEPHQALSGSSRNEIIDFEILVPHYSQRIYDKEETRKYKAKVTVKLKPNWRITSGQLEQIITYILPEMKKKNTLQQALKTNPASFSFKQIKSDHTNEPPRELTVHLNLQTPTLLLSLHEPGKFAEEKPLAYRPESEEEDTNEEYGTTYAGLMLRNEDNDDEDEIPEPPSQDPIPRDNDDEKVSNKDNDLIGLRIETLQPEDFAFEDKLTLRLKFNHTDKQIQVFDSKSKSTAKKVSLQTLAEGVVLNKKSTPDEHLGTAIKKGKKLFTLKD